MDCLRIALALVAVALAVSTAFGAESAPVPATPAPAAGPQPGVVVLHENGNVTVRTGAAAMPGEPGSFIYIGGPEAGGNFRFQVPPAGLRPGTFGVDAALMPPMAWGGTKEKVTFLGVATTPASEILADQLRLPRGTGLVVDYVRPDSPAAKAGARAHDILLRLDDQILVNPPQLAVLVRLHKPGDKVTLALLREGKEEKVAAELGETEMVVAPSPEFMPGHPGAPLGDMMNWRFRPEHLTDAGVRPELMTPFPGGSFAGYGAALSDNEHNLTMTLRNGEKYLVAKDRNGKVVFEGPVQTDEQKKSVPPEILKKLARMEEATKAGAKGEVRINDGVHDLAVSTEDGKRHLVAKDAKSGKVLFDGPIDTDEQRNAVPKDIREKLKAMNPSIITMPDTGASPM